MLIVDSHCHLLILEEEKHLSVEKIIEDSNNKNVKILQNVCVCIDQFEKTYSYAQKFKNVFSSIGIHPLYCNAGKTDFILFKNYLDDHKSYSKINSIGECGLDYSRLTDEIDEKTKFQEIRLQQSIFLQQIELADEYNLPLIIHTRDAEIDTYNLISTSIKLRQNVRGVMHCFTGTPELAWAMIDLGFYISFSGIITFKKKIEHLQKLATELPLDKILVETDSPYLSPEPFRGRNNVPEHTHLVVEKIAQLRQLSVEEVANQTTKNYFTLFNKTANSPHTDF